MTTNAEYVAPCAEEPFASYKATHDINKSRENRLCERFFFFFFFFALGTTVMRHGNSVYKTFCMETAAVKITLLYWMNGCLV